MNLPGVVEVLLSGQRWVFRVGMDGRIRVDFVDLDPPVDDPEVGPSVADRCDFECAPQLLGVGHVPEES